MNLYIQLLVIPIIAGTIGWFTNKIAVWLLFNPREPKKILGFTIQGIFPKRQMEIASHIGTMVSENLLSSEDIKNKIFTSDNIQKIEGFLEEKITDYLDTELKEAYPIASNFIGKKSKEKIKHNVVSKVAAIIKDLEDNFEDYLSNQVNVKDMVQQKIAGLDTGEVNNLMNQILNNELRFIEYVGAILGFVIGLIQVLLLWWIGG
jgi:uncharacterized membrane protein YheB (UPF0754 family)